MTIFIQNRKDCVCVCVCVSIVCTVVAAAVALILFARPHRLVTSFLLVKVCAYVCLCVFVYVWPVPNSKLVAMQAHDVCDENAATKTKNQQPKTGPRTCFLSRFLFRFSDQTRLKQNYAQPPVIVRRFLFLNDLLGGFAVGEEGIGKCCILTARCINSYQLLTT